jgi:hypothetical protein
MAFDEVENHLNRCHSKVIGAQEHERHSETLEHADGRRPSMVASIVKHNHGVLPPLLVFAIQVSDQLRHEQSEGIAIGLARVDCVEQLSTTTDGGDDVEAPQFRSACDLILLRLQDPSMVTLIGVSEN